MNRPRQSSRGDTPASIPSRVPPHSDDAERAVLGAAMRFADVVDVVAPIIGDAEAFYHGRHQKLWRAILATHAAGVTPDEASVAVELSKRGELGTDAGAVPPVYLTDLTLPTVTPESAKRHAAVIREYATRRTAYRALAEGMEALYDLAVDPFEHIETMQTTLGSLALRPTGSTSYHYATMFADVVAEIERRQSEGQGLAGMQCGLADLDRRLSGFMRGDNVILAARPAMGKTSLGVAIAEGLARNGHPGLIISLEMSALSLGMRSLSRVGRVSAEKLRGGRVSADEWRSLLDAVERLSRLGISIEDGSSMSIAQMSALVKRYKRTQRIEWVVLDYLQLGSASGASSRELEISAISRGGKQIAKEHDVCWLALSQLNRAVESRGDKRPMLSDLRESGSIEADADVVMFLYRPEYYGIPQDEDGNPTEGIAEVIIGKQRNGPTGTVRLAFHSEYVAFENLNPRDDAPDRLPTPAERFGSARDTWTPNPAYAHNGIGNYDDPDPLND